MSRTSHLSLAAALAVTAAVPMTAGPALSASAAHPTASAVVSTAAGTAPATSAPAEGRGGRSAAAVQARVVARLRSATAATARAVGISGRERLILRSVVRSADGTSYARYERTYAGLPVVGGDLVVAHKASGAVRSVTFNRRRAVGVRSLTPRLSPQAATGGARRAAGGLRLNGATVRSRTLVIANGPRSPRLAYDVLTTGTRRDQTPSRLHTLIDARTGAVLQQWDEIETGSGNGIYDRGVTLGTTASSGSYLLRDSRGNVTTDLKNRTSGTGTTFTDADDVWGTGTNSSRQSAAVDAHFGAEATYSYYSSVLGRAGIWNDGTGARSRVHYGRGYVNAFWDGTQMTYGDGASDAAPLTELDVAGHEMSHGVTENTANLTYSGESGGLNEATSDIFGTAVEWNASLSSDAPDYLIGERLGLGAGGGPLRYMDRPSKDGASRDCYSSSLGSLDPHYSSGPLNHWYFMLSVGSGAKTVNGVSYNSPTCSGAPAVTGIGHLAAEKIWYRALSTKLTSSSGYLQARNAAITSAKELYGAGSSQCLATEAAFTAIAVPKGTATCN